METNNLENLLRKNIEAADRTTYAVRAFVRFLFIQLSAITIASLVFVISAAASFPGGQTVAAIIIIVGVVMSSTAGWSELQKSVIPETNLETLGQTGFSNSHKSDDLRKVNLMTDEQLQLWDSSGRPLLTTWDEKSQTFEEWINRRR